MHRPIDTWARKMLVLAAFQGNYIAMLHYTHNERSLEGKVKPEEFVSVRDYRAKAISLHYRCINGWLLSI